MKSQRIRKGVRRLRAYTPGEQWRVPGLVKLNTNENPYPPSPRVARACRELDAACLRRYPDPACAALRARLARLHGVAPDRIFVGNGSDEILALASRAFVEDDGSIGYFNPSYSLYPVLAAIRQVEARPVELGPAFEWRMPRAYRCSLFYMANPNAPTSVRYPHDTVARFCRDVPGVVLIDEAYVDFAREHCMDLARRLPNVLVMRTLSKSFSLAGLRVGYAVGARPLIAALFKLKDSYNVDAVAQRLALAALSDPGWMRRNTAKIRATRARLTRLLAERGASVLPSETNFLWLRPPRPGAREWYRRLRARRILVRYFPGRRTGRYLRVSVGTDAEVDALVAAMDSILSGSRT